MIGKITLVERQELLNRLIGEWVHPQKPFVLAFANAHAMNLAAESQSFAYDLSKADVVVRDGTGIARLFNLMNMNPGLNLNGTDLIPELIPWFAKKRIVLLGTQEPYLSAARMKILDEMAPGSEIHLMDGFNPAPEYVSFCSRVEPDLIILGMGMPKQESVSRLLREQLTKPCLIVCGGAIIDFLGGKVSRAPDWIRKFGLEWVYRLLLEPKRLFRRYVIGNPLFLVRARKYTRNARVTSLDSVSESDQ